MGTVITVVPLRLMHRCCSAEGNFFKNEILLTPSRLDGSLHYSMQLLNMSSLKYIFK